MWRLLLDRFYYASLIIIHSLYFPMNKQMDNSFRSWQEISEDTRGNMELAEFIRDKRKKSSIESYQINLELNSQKKKLKNHLTQN